METKTFSIEYHSDTPELTDELKAKIDKRVEKLALGKSDISGASVAVTTDGGNSQLREYRVRLVAYKWPRNIAAVAKDTSISIAVGNALDALERQVRQQRNKRRDKKKRM